MGHLADAYQGMTYCGVFIWRQIQGCWPCSFVCCCCNRRFSRCACGETMWAFADSDSGYATMKRILCSRCFPAGFQGPEGCLHCIERHEWLAAAERYRVQKDQRVLAAERRSTHATLRGALPVLVTWFGAPESRTAEAPSPLGCAQKAPILWVVAQYLLVEPDLVVPVRNAVIRLFYAAVPGTAGLVFPETESVLTCAQKRRGRRPLLVSV